jgi:hypothetical protein
MQAVTDEFELFAGGKEFPGEVFESRVMLHCIEGAQPQSTQRGRGRREAESGQNPPT